MAVDEGLQNELQKHGVYVTTWDKLVNWGRGNSIWPLQFGLACCAIEMIHMAMPRYDIERFGLSFVASPRHADVLTVSGPVTRNMEHALKTAYEMTPEPRLVVALPVRPSDLRGGAWRAFCAYRHPLPTPGWF